MRIRSLAVVAAAGIYLACGGGDGDGGGGPNPVNVLTKASGDGQNGTVNVQLANDFCAKVTQGGAAKGGVTVSWTTSTGGTMSVPSSLTDTDGIACSNLKLGTTAGAQSAQAAVAGATGSPVTFSATANAGNATALVKSGGDAQQGTVGAPLGEALSVQVTDNFGNGVGGALVTWDVTPGQASVDPVSGNTNGTGLASTSVTLGPNPGAIIIVASSAGLTGSPQNFTVTANPATPAPNAITITVQNNAFSPGVDTVAAGGTVTFTWANTVGVTHSVTSTGPTSFTSDPAGAIASPHSYGPVTFNTPGTYFYYCTVHGSPGSPPTGMSGRIVVQ
jgi:plastocyanin